ncbi:hypothetical protein EBU99_08130 [bacterium]|nr:hypothetical protein [bacterium]
MTQVTTREYKIERRTLLKWTAAAIAVGKFVDFDEVLAAGECSALSDLPKLSEAIAGKPQINTNTNVDPNFLYWIDGPLNTSLSGYPASGALITRARLACTMHIDHGPTLGKPFIETVALVNDANEVMAQNFYSPADGLSTGKAPFTVFENLALDPTKNYKVIYIKNLGTKDAMGNQQINIYVHTIDKSNIRPSRFDYTHLPELTRNTHILPMLHQELNGTIAAVAGGAPPAVNYKFNAGGPTGTGYMTTPYGTWQMGPHTARATIKSIGAAGSVQAGEFDISVELMHGDDAGSAGGHYMRWFIVLDPVGRVLGAVRRNFGDGFAGSSVNVTRGFWTITNSAGAKDKMVVKDLSGNVIVSALSPAVEEQYSKAASILDCPYIQILTDDKYHAMARCIMRLR